MSGGLMVWDENGVLIVSEQDRLGRIIGSIMVGPSDSGARTISAGYGQLWAVPVLSGMNSQSPMYSPLITLLDDGLSFRFSPNVNFPGGARPCAILWGVR